MAHKKGGGSSRNGRDSNPQRLGFRVYEGQYVGASGIIVLQRGTRFLPGRNVKRAKNDTLFSTIEGVMYMDGAGRRVNVKTLEEAEVDKAAMRSAMAAKSVS